ncbi:hypothetical protein [Brevibacillus borstelensis]|uniref:hypothetical protein n=1 Tax=Brevibacillus borstelensis TaxID=45462 RepID=UPI0030C3D93D
MSLMMYLVLMPIIMAWSTGIPLLLLAICVFLTMIFKTRAYMNMLVTVPLSFLLYEMVLPETGLIVFGWEFSLLMALNTAWNVQLLIWLVQKIVKSLRNHPEANK